jgi:hypothetical protein
VVEHLPSKCEALETVRRLVWVRTPVTGKNCGEGQVTQDFGGCGIASGVYSQWH